MNWKLNELLFELAEDPKRRILFVEGERDLIFWKRLIPKSFRKDTEIYPISVMQCADVDGGERGRLMWCARQFLTTDKYLRVLFFADADWDRILSRPCPLNTYFTDGRDMESYGLTVGHFEHLASTGFRLSEHEASGLYKFTVDTVKPLSLLRIVSEQKGLRLPFQKTLGERFSRYFEGKKFSIIFDIDRLLAALLNRGGISLSRAADILQNVEDERRKLSSTSDEQVLHGKDVLGFLAYFFGTDVMPIEAAYFLALDRAAICRKEIISLVSGWMTKADA
ncbi:MAG TPA: hypothetical protein VGH02_13400 [Rhizomicrobium sp.]